MIIVDESDRTETLIREALTPELHSSLLDETHRMLEAGAQIEDIVWVLHPGGGIAERRQELDLVDGRSGAQVPVVLPERVSGKMLVVHMGREGIHCVRWNSILTAKAGAA